MEKDKRIEKDKRVMDEFLKKYILNGANKVEAVKLNLLVDREATNLSCVEYFYAGVEDGKITLTPGAVLSIVNNANVLFEKSFTNKPKKRVRQARLHHEVLRPNVTCNELLSQTATFELHYNDIPSGPVYSFEMTADYRLDPHDPNIFSSKTSIIDTFKQDYNMPGEFLESIIIIFPNRNERPLVIPCVEGINPFNTLCMDYTNFKIISNYGKAATHTRVTTTKDNILDMVQDDLYEEVKKNQETKFSIEDLSSRYYLFDEFLKAAYSGPVQEYVLTCNDACYTVPKELYNPFTATIEASRPVTIGKEIKKREKLNFGEFSYRYPDLADYLEAFMQMNPPNVNTKEDDSSSYMMLTYEKVDLDWLPHDIQCVNVFKKTYSLKSNKSNNCKSFMSTPGVATIKRVCTYFVFGNHFVLEVGKYSYNHLPDATDWFKLFYFKHYENSGFDTEIATGLEYLITSGIRNRLTAGSSHNNISLILNKYNTDGDMFETTNMKILRDTPEQTIIECTGTDGVFNATVNNYSGKINVNSSVIYYSPNIPCAEDEKDPTKIVIPNLLGFPTTLEKFVNNYIVIK